MFRYNFYESRLNSFKVIVIILFITPIYPIITPISGTNTRGILGLLICFSMLYQQYMLTFSACYEFVPGLYEF